MSIVTILVEFTKLITIHYDQKAFSISKLLKYVEKTAIHLYICFLLPSLFSLSLDTLLISTEFEKNIS